MAYNQLPPCDLEVFTKGEAVALLDSSRDDGDVLIERWVKAVAEKASTRLDWHYSGGVAQVLHLGDVESRARACIAMEELRPMLKGAYVQLLHSGEEGLHRRGVTQAPPGAVMVCVNPLTGEQEYRSIIDPTDKK